MIDYLFDRRFGRGGRIGFAARRRRLHRLVMQPDQALGLFVAQGALDAGRFDAVAERHGAALLLADADHVRDMRLARLDRGGLGARDEAGFAIDIDGGQVQRVAGVAVGNGKLRVRRPV